MPVFDLGTLTIVSHDAETFIEALGIPKSREDAIIDLAYEAWQHEDTISESIEYLASRLHSSELVLALVTFGRIWEEVDSRDDSDDSSESAEEGPPEFGY